MKQKLLDFFIGFTTDTLGVCVGFKGITFFVLEFGDESSYIILFNPLCDILIVFNFISVSSINLLNSIINKAYIL